MVSEGITETIYIQATYPPQHKPINTPTVNLSTKAETDPPLFLEQY
jgi:hypothetical protein